MTQPATITTSQFQQVERRIESLETAMRRLLNIFDTKSASEVHRLSEKAERRYFQDLVEFLQQQKEHPTPGATSADELMAQLEQV